MLNLIPIHDENPTFRTAWVTIALIAINLVVFLVEPVALSISGNPSSAADACRQEAFFRRYAAIPKELTSNRQLPLTITSGQPRVEGNQVACPVGRPTFDKLPALSVLYAMFLHGSWLHILGNMLFLWVFGNNVEDRLGRVRYLFFYLLCGYLATYGFALADPSSTTTLVGASGAIAGVLGAYLVLYPRARVTSLVPFLFFFPAPPPASDLAAVADPLPIGSAPPAKGAPHDDHQLVDGAAAGSARPLEAPAAGPRARRRAPGGGACAGRVRRSGRAAGRLRLLAGQRRRRRDRAARARRGRRGQARVRPHLRRAALAAEQLSGLRRERHSHHPDRVGAGAGPGARRPPGGARHLRRRRRGNRRGGRGGRRGG